MTQNDKPTQPAPVTDVADDGDVSLEDLKNFEVRSIDKLSLEQLIEEANRTIGHLNALERMTLPRAVYLGRILTAIKAKKGHGNWEQWLKDNIDGCSPRKVQDYMKLANLEAEGNLDLKNADFADLPIYRALAEAKEREERLKPPKRRGKPRNTNGGGGTLDPEEQDLVVLCGTYEDTSEKIRDRFHKWMIEQYGLGVIPLDPDILKEGLPWQDKA